MDNEDMYWDDINDYEPIPCWDENGELPEDNEFNQDECDWRYRAACTADADCADGCSMKCPYKKE